MSDKKNQYFTVVFDALVDAKPKEIRNVIHRWLYTEPHVASVHIEQQPESGPPAFFTIQLRLNDDIDQISILHQYAGTVSIGGGRSKPHVRVYFFDWETADDRSDAYSVARKNNFATVPNQQKIFEQLAQALRRALFVLQDNLKATDNANIVLDAIPGVESVSLQADGGETWQPWLHIPDEKNYRQIIELWCKGKNAKEIAKEVFVGAPTIYNIVSDLRKSYPEARIPKDRERKSMRF